jgi:hypothetical protein
MGWAREDRTEHEVIDGRVRAIDDLPGAVHRATDERLGS